MKLIFLLFFSLSFVINSSFFPKENDRCRNSYHLLEQAKLRHDSHNNWKNTELRFHIQEPRIANPYRYSKIKLDNKSNAFEIERNRSDGTEKRIINEKGEFHALFNESEDIPLEIIDKYGLNKERSFGYKNFYATMYGLPMSITENIYENLDTAEFIKFDGKEAYEIKMTLKENMISKYWSIYLDANDYTILGLEFSFPNDPAKDEILKFEGEVSVNGIIIPRIRNWYSKNSNEYLGSDIIVKEIEE